jgi:hypothetical protein
MANEAEAFKSAMGKTWIFSSFSVPLDRGRLIGALRARTGDDRGFQGRRERMPVCDGKNILAGFNDLTVPPSR